MVLPKPASCCATLSLCKQARQTRGKDTAQKAGFYPKRPLDQRIGKSSEGATKGVFVTTSDFSKEARDYLLKVQHRIVLVNGERLARLMIQHEVGVRARKTYVLRSVDEDYFSEV